MIPTNLSFPSPWAHNTKALLNELLQFFSGKDPILGKKSVCARQFSVFVSAWMPNTTAFKCFSGLEEVLFSWKKSCLIEPDTLLSNTHILSLKPTELKQEHVKQLNEWRNYLCVVIHAALYARSFISAVVGYFSSFTISDEEGIRAVFIKTISLFYSYCCEPSLRLKNV